MSSCLVRLKIPTLVSDRMTSFNFCHFVTPLPVTSFTDDLKDLFGHRDLYDAVYVAKWTHPKLAMFLLQIVIV